jgi:hypothetical protein
VDLFAVRISFSNVVCLFAQLLSTTANSSLLMAVGRYSVPTMDSRLALQSGGTVTGNNTQLELTFVPPQSNIYYLIGVYNNGSEAAAFSVTAPQSFRFNPPVNPQAVDSTFWTEPNTKP